MKARAKKARATLLATLAIGGFAGVGLEVTGSSAPPARGPKVSHVSPPPAPASSGHHGSPHTTSPHISPAAPAAEPGSLQVFGVTGTRASLSKSPYVSDWEQMLSDQQHYMKNPQYARQYRSFLAQFNKFRGEPLMQMATNVNATVQNEVKYSDYTNCSTPNTDSNNCSTANYFWPAPIATALEGKGNCIDQADLQYFVERYLGVPASRLFIADVNAEGDQTAGPDHAILLLNTAPAGAAPKLVIMNDTKPVIPANEASVEKTWINPPGNTPSDYTFYDAFNEASSWLTKYTPDDYTTSPGQQASSSTSTLPATQAKFSIKLG